MNTNWTVTTETREHPDKNAPNMSVSIITVYLKFQGRTVAQGSGRMAEQNMTAQADEWNRSGYSPKTTLGLCVADHPPEKRSEVIKRMKNSTEALPGLVMNPEQNSNARDKFFNIGRRRKSE